MFVPGRDAVCVCVGYKYCTPPIEMWMLFTVWLLPFTLFKPCLVVEMKIEPFDYNMKKKVREQMVGP